MCGKKPSGCPPQPHSSKATDQGLFLLPGGADSDLEPQGPCWPSTSGTRAPETSTACPCSQSLSQPSHRFILKDGSSRARCNNLTGEETGLRGKG